jgi:glucose/arabinose dehydrogenase
MQTAHRLLTATLLLLLAACANAAPPATVDEAPTDAEAVATEVAEPTAAEGEETVAEPTVESAALPQPAFADPAAYQWALVADGFSSPILVTNAGDGSGRLFVVAQDGVIWVVRDRVTNAEPFLDIRYEVGSQDNEQGLLGLAFHPNYEENAMFYVNYTDLNGDTVISSFSADGDLGNPDSEQILLQVDQPYPNHNGGHLEFGPDSYLYIGLGDGGSGGDPHDNGQNLDTLLGKMLRIDVGTGSTYEIPADNPFGDEIWAYGLRNPWRFGFDRATGDLYIADVGQGEWEEVSFLPGGIAGGANLGWRYFEGTHPYEGTAPDESSLVFPVAEYDHSGRCSVTGGYAYRGAALPEWQGVYFYGDFCSGEIFGLLQHPDGAWESQLLYQSGFLITSFGQDENGELYVLDRNGGLYRLETN